MVGTRRSKREASNNNKREDQRTITDFFSKQPGPSSLSSTPRKPLATTIPPPEGTPPPPLERRLNYNLQPVHGVRALDSCSLDLTALADCERAKSVSTADAKRKQLTQLLAADIIGVDALPDTPSVDIDIETETERVHQQFMNLDTSLDGSMANKSSRSSKVSKRRSQKKPRNTIAKKEEEVLTVLMTPTPRRSPRIAGEPVDAVPSSVTTRATRRKRRSKQKHDGDAVMSEQPKTNDGNSEGLNLCGSDSDSPTKNTTSSSPPRIATSPPPNKLSKTEPEEVPSSAKGRKNSVFNAALEQQTRNNNSADALDSDGDNRMEDEAVDSEPSAMEEEKDASIREPAATRSPENKADDNDSESSDEEELLRELEQESRKSERLKASLARAAGGDTSSDMKMEMSSASVRASAKSVFGTTNYRKEAAQTSRQIAKVLKERNRRDALEEENKELRNDMVESDKKEMDAEERIIKTMADLESANAQERKRIHEKYHACVALFISKPTFPGAPRKETRNMWSSPEKKKPTRHKHRQRKPHQLADLVNKAQENGTSCGRMFLKAVDLCCASSKLSPPNYVGDMLFDRVVFDESHVNHHAPTLYSRETEFEALILLISYATKELPLPSMMTVLTAYGAAYNPRRYAPDIMEDADAGSFDKKMMGAGGLDAAAERGIRNLTRAFAVWTRQVESEMELSKILGENLRYRRPGFSWAASYILKILGLCFDILLSPFGSRLAPALEPLFDALLDRVKQKEWDAFRQECAKDAMEYTRGRLGLIADLTTYLMSVRTQRGRALGLDISYLTLACWRKGPPEAPQMTPVEEFQWPTTKSYKGGCSYRFKHIIDIVAGIPELGKESEVAWALALARLLNHATIHHDVLDSRKKGEYLRLANVVKRIRLWSHRMEYGVAQKKFQFALDSLITATQGFIGHAIANKELNPGAKAWVRQSTLAFGMVRK